jgi:hypothetical protein
MTVDVSVQSKYVVLKPESIAVSEQALYAAIFPGTRVTVTEQSLYVALFNTAVGRRPRRVMAVVSS